MKATLSILALAVIAIALNLGVLTASHRHDGSMKLPGVLSVI